MSRTRRDASMLQGTSTCSLLRESTMAGWAFAETLAWEGGIMVRSRDLLSREDELDGCDGNDLGSCYFPRHILRIWFAAEVDISHVSSTKSCIENKVACKLDSITFESGEVLIRRSKEVVAANCLACVSTDDFVP